MFSMVMALLLAGAGSPESGSRAQFMACVRGAMEKASAAKVAPDAFAAFARQSCSGELSTFRNDLVAYDIRAGWTRKKAEPDADGQIGDALADWTDRYRDKGSITASK